MNFSFDIASTKISSKNCSCIFERLRSYSQVSDDPLFLTGLVLLFIGLFLGLLIIIIRKLKSPSKMNSVFIVITMIIMTVGLGLLISCEKWYEITISLPAATGLTIVAILMGIRLKNIEKKFKMILLTIFCVATVIGLILFLIGLILEDHVLQSDAWICWCCVAFIGIIFATDYLHIHRGQFSKIYVIFVLFYECFLLNITSDFFVSLLFDCNWTSVNNLLNPEPQQLNKTIIRHDERILFV
ncbi:unnamed protein product [Schistosoma margrebowiei]|nr:unnamed protein product [Schistosoma margrebowiei]